MEVVDLPDKEIKQPSVLLWMAPYIALSVVALTSVIWGYRGEVAQVEQSYRSEGDARIEDAGHLTNAFVESQDRDLKFLSKRFSALTDGLNDAVAGQRLAEFLSSYLVAHQEYFQARWLATDGKELVKIVRGPNGVEIIPANQLQDKSSRGYFQSLQSLQPGEHYLSAFDLNVENGRIQQPIQPVIRVGEIVTDGMGNPRGYLVLNYDGHQLLDDLQTVSPRIWLASGAGHWMLGPSQELEWGNITGNNSLSIAGRYPEIWPQLSSGTSGASRNQDGLWLYRSLLIPDESGALSNSGFTLGKHEADEGSYPWRLVYFVSEETIAARLADIKQRYLLIGAAVLLLALLSGVFVVRLLKGQFSAAMRLEQARSEAEALIGAAPDGLLVVDEHGVIVDVNAEAERVFGGERDDLVGQPIEMLVPMGQRKQHPGKVSSYFENPYRRALGKGGSISALRVDGTEFPAAVALNGYVSASGRRVVCTVRDVTERVAQERDLKASEQKLSLALQASKQGLFVLDVSSRMVHLTPCAREVFGFVEERLDYRVEEVKKLVHPDDRKRSHAQTAAGLSEDGYYNDIQYRIHAENGHEKWLSQSATVAKRNELGHPLEIVGTVRDITQAKDQERELISVSIAAEQASTAKSQFLANMSHEIRTPLNATIGFMKLLRASELTGEQKEFVNSSLEASEHLLGLLTNILEVSRIESEILNLAAKPFNLKQALNQMMALLQREANNQGLTLDLLIDAKCPDIVVGDQTRLVQILTNLAGNALKFTPDGGVAVEVFVRSGAPNGKVRLMFEVRDTGVGMHPDQVEDLFKPFRQADESNTRIDQGVGLGLAISNRLVQMMGGIIMVDTAPGEGSCFHFTVDVALPETKEEDPVAGNVVPFQRGDEHLPDTLKGLKLLVAEDNRLNQQMMKLLLKKLGADFDIAVDGEEAVRYILEQGKQYDAVLMDIQMPNMDGLEATIKLRDHFDASQLPIFAVSANAQVNDREAAINAGMNSFLAKPVDGDELKLVVLRLLHPKVASAIAES